MVGIECKGATFLTSFKEGPHQKLFFQGFFQNSASKMANYIMVDIICNYWQTLSNSFLVFISFHYNMEVE